MWFVLDQLTLLACYWWIARSQQRAGAKYFARANYDPDLAQLVAYAAIAAVLSGSLHSIRISLGGMPETLDTGWLWAGGACLAVVAGCAAGLTWAGSPPSEHRRGSTGAAVLLTVLGVMTHSMVSLRDLNIDLDSSRAAPIVTTIVDKSDYRPGRRAPGSPPVLILAGWDGREEVVLQVRRAEYRRFKPGQRIRLFQHDGALGAPWVDKIETTR